MDGMGYGSEMIEMVRLFVLTLLGGACRFGCV